jgi:phosphoglycolate phosphatase
VECLIFDLDGTLVDSFAGIQLGLNRALQELGRPRRDLGWVRRHVGWGARHLVQAAAVEGLDPEILLERFRHHYGEVLTGHTPPYPGVDCALRELAAGHTLAIASNKPEPWLVRLVEHLGWSRLMAAVVGPESVAAPKPAAAMVELVLQRTGCPRQGTLLVGDMPVDVETGRNAGVAVLAVASGLTPAAELERLGCIAVLAGVAELPGWLANKAKAVDTLPAPLL